MDNYSYRVFHHIKHASSRNGSTMSRRYHPASNKNLTIPSFKTFQSDIENKHTHTGKATKGKVQDIGEVNKVMPLPLPSSDRVRG